MNIAAVMAALRIDDLDRTAKHAVVMVACRASQYTAAAEVSTGRLAVDMKVNRKTAALALGRAVDAGYLLVEKLPGVCPVWRLSSRLTCVIGAPHLSNPRPLPDQPEWTRRSIKEKDKDRVAAHAHLTVAGAAGENPPGSWTRDLPPNPWILDEKTGTAIRNPILDPARIAECVYCDDHGRLWVEDRPVGQCTHRTPEYTIDDILNTPADPDV